MSDTLPKIWASSFVMESENVREMNFYADGEKLEYIHEFRRGELTTPDRAPKYVYFGLFDLKDEYRANTPDWVMIEGGVFLISEKLRDLLARFDLGATQLFGVPLYEYDQKTQRPGRWFILHIVAKKKTVVPEKSVNVKEDAVKGFWSPNPWKGEDTLAVRSASAEGEDLWVDPYFSSRMFLSDRLVSAMKAQKIRVRKLGLRPWLVVTDGGRDA